MHNQIRKSPKRIGRAARFVQDSTMPQELSAYSKAKRELILNAAIKLFLAEGYAATSMNRVAVVSGVTKQTIYSHFQDKDGLFVAIIESVTIKHMEDRFGGQPITGDPESVLRSFAGVLIGRQKDEQYLNLIRTVIAESARFPKLAQLFVRTVIKRGIEMLSAFFDSHKELGIKDSQATARIFCGSLIGCIISQEILHGKEIIPFEVDRIVDALVDQILRC